MRLFRSEQMRQADAAASAAGVPTARLMRAAGLAVARELLEHFPRTRLVVVLCGRGNNGGDGFVAAARLRQLGVDVRLFELEGAGTAPGDATDARSAYLRAGGKAQALGERSAPELLALLAAFAARAPGGPRPVVVDALFGSGLDRSLTGWLAALVEQLPRSGAAVVAVDVPSGLVADLAVPPGAHVRADLTVELAGHKPAALFYPARAAYGATVLVDIGIPAQVLDACSDVRVLTSEHVRAALPPPLPAGHKYDAGTVCVIAGSRRYLGAADLACRGAWRAGAGLVTLVAEERFPGGWPETILEPHAWAPVAGGASTGGVAAWPPVGLDARRAGACVIGPGLEPSALEWLPEMLAWAPGPVVLDAAALEPRALARARDTLARTPAVLTPHAGEAARLLRALAPTGADLLTTDPLAAAARLAESTGALVVLKGPTTVVAAPGGRLAVSTRGTPAMASGGTGDVLAGVLGGLLARAATAETLFETVCLGVWLHGVAGELAAAKVGDSLVASDLVECVPRALQLLAR